MARTKQNQRSANRGTVPMGATGGRTPPSKVTMALFATSIISAVWAAAMLTTAGRIAYAYLFVYSEFYMGVLTLVSLSVTVMLGLVATDRMVLSVRQRVLMQSAHRTTGIIAVTALLIHLVTKVSMNRMAVIDIFVPFLARNQTLYIGLGTVAAYFMVSVLWTGLIRARFAGRGKPWMWRSLHSTAYLSWPIALLHGLNAGRAAASWVIVSYIVCVLFVLVALAVRLSVSLGRKKNFSSTSTGSMKPVGSLVPTAAPSAKSRMKRRPERPAAEPMAARVVADRANAPAAVLDTWVPAAGGGPVAPVSARPVSAGPVAPVSSRPMSSRPVSAGPVAPVTARPSNAPVSAGPYDDEAYRTEGHPRRYDDEPAVPRSRRSAERYDEDRHDRERYADDRYDEAPRPRSRRYADDDEPVAPRARRSAERYADERYDEVTRPISRRAIEEGTRRYADERYDEAPRPRSRRYADDDEPVAPRPRREIEPRREVEARDRFTEEERPAPRSRRYADDDAPAPRQRYADEERYSEAPRPRSARGPRYADEEEAPRGRPGPEDSGRHSRADFVRTSAAAPTTGGPVLGGPVLGGPGLGGPVNGRPSAAAVSGAGWTVTGDADHLPPDDTPTLIDMASRRARRTAVSSTSTGTDTGRGASRGARRKGGRAGTEVAADDLADDAYWRQLRGEAN